MCSFCQAPLCHNYISPLVSLQVWRQDKWHISDWLSHLRKIFVSHLLCPLIKFSRVNSYHNIKVFSRILISAPLGWLPYFICSHMGNFLFHIHMGCNFKYININASILFINISERQHCLCHGNKVYMVLMMIQFIDCNDDSHLYSLSLVNYCLKVLWSRDIFISMKYTKSVYCIFYLFSIIDLSIFSFISFVHILVC